MTGSRRGRIRTRQRASTSWRGHVPTSTATSSRIGCVGGHVRAGADRRHERIHRSPATCRHPARQLRPAAARRESTELPGRCSRIQARPRRRESTSSTGTRTYHDDVFQVGRVGSHARGRADVSPGTTVIDDLVPFVGYFARRPAPPDTAPTSSTENPSTVYLGKPRIPARATTQGVYKLTGTRTYHDDVFQSAEWAVTRVRGPIIVVNTFEYVYRLSVGTPPSPLGGTSTEDHIPANWFALADKPSPTPTQGVYRSDRSTRYEDDVFIRATAWRTPTLVPGEGPTGGLLAPGSVSVSAAITTVKGTTTQLVSGSWNGVVGASGGYQYQLENTTKGTSTSGSVTAARSFSKTNFAISVGDTVRLRVRARGDVADMSVGPWSGWVSDNRDRIKKGRG